MVVDGVVANGTVVNGMVVNGVVVDGAVVNGVVVDKVVVNGAAAIAVKRGGSDGVVWGSKDGSDSGDGDCHMGQLDVPRDTQCRR